MERINGDRGTLEVENGMVKVYRHHALYGRSPEPRQFALNTVELAVEPWCGDPFYSVVLRQPSGTSEEIAFAHRSTAEGALERIKALQVEEIVRQLEGIQETLDPNNGKDFGGQYVLLDDIADFGGELFQKLIDLDPDRARELDPEYFEQEEAFKASYIAQFGHQGWEDYLAEELEYYRHLEEDELEAEREFYKGVGL